MWPAPDWEAADIRRDGERLASKVRLRAALALAMLPIGNIVFEPPDVEPWIGLGGALLLILGSSAIDRLAQQRTQPAWLGFASSLFDISVVTAGNAAFILAGQPLAATNGRIFFAAYLLALSFSCLRQDVRISVVAGSAAFVQYAAIVTWAYVAAANAGALTHPTYGAFRWDNQIGRLVIVVIATAINIAIVRQARRFLRASFEDSLTGLANRRYAIGRLSDAIAAAARSHSTFVIALADVDHFKRVNDRFGHATGDAALRQIARELRDFYRASDLVARFGGEEFLILLPDADCDGAVERLRQFHAHFAATPIATHSRVNGSIRLTLSVGVAVYPRDGDTIEQLLARADERLYAAKEAGRNRVAVARGGGQALLPVPL